MAASWKTLRVFISSTFKDMHAERDHLVRFVFPKLREVLLKHRVHLIDVDLRWGVTSEQDSVAACREVIDECHPRFMGMLGGRYGWVPPESDQSITEDEVHYGVLERDAEMWGNAFFYFRDEEATASIVEKAPGDFREPAGSGNARKLVELKQSIVNAGLPTFTYGARWDVQQKRLTGLEAFGEHVYAYLLKNIQDDPELDDHFASDTTGPVDEFAEEREAMEAFIEDRTERYVVGSREALLDKMTAFAASNSEQNILVIEGEPGSGKSSLLGNLCKLRATQGPSLLISHFVGASVGSTDLRRTLRRLCHELAVVSGNTDLMPEDIRELIDLFNKLLGEVAAQQRVVLVIDAINQFDATDGAHNMSWLPQELPPNVRIIASSLEHPALVALRNRSEPVRIEKLEPLSEADTRAIVAAFLRRYSKRFSAEQITALLAKPESRLPLYVLTALEELRTLGTYEEITARIRELPGEAKALFGWILKQRLSNDPGFLNGEGQLCGSGLVAKFASFLGVSRHGLSQEELIGLIDSGDPLGNVAALLRLLRPYLMHRGELMDFFHNQLREAVEDEYLKSADHRLEAHQLLATYFHDVADPNREGHWKGTSTHALSELPYHHVRAKAWPELVATLENIFFLEAKVTHGMAFDLVLEFSDALTHLPSDHPQHRNLKLLEEALRRDLHFIARNALAYPQALFQCLWNLCWWYDCSEAAFHYEAPNDGWKHPPPWTHQRTDLKLSALLERWGTEREAVHPGFYWLRSLRPLPTPLGVGQLAVLRGHEGQVYSVAFSPDGHRILSGSDDKTVRLWDPTSGRELAVLRGHQSIVFAVAYSPDGRRILSGSGDSTVRLWDAGSGHELLVLRGHKYGVHGVAFSPDGRRILSGSEDSTMRLWDIESGRELAVLSGPNSAVISVAFSPDGRRVLSGSVQLNRDQREDNSVRLWDAESGRELTVFRGHTNGVNSVAFSPDSRLVLSGSWDKTVRIWDAENGSELAVLSGHTKKVTTVAFSFDGRYVLSGSWDKSVRVWHTESGREIAVLRGHQSIVFAVAYSPDGRRILSGSGDSTVRLWDAGGERELAVLRGHKKKVTCLAFSRDGYHMITGSEDRTARIWSAINGRELTVLSGHEGSIECVAFSPDGHHALSGSEDKTARLWDVESGRELAVLSGHEGSVGCVAFSLDAHHVFSGSADRTVRRWDTANRRELIILHGNQNVIARVAVSPDGRRIISRDGPGKVLVWDAETGQPLNELLSDRNALDDHATGSELWQCGRYSGEIHIRRLRSWEPEARFFEYLQGFQCHSSGRIWAGSSGGQFVLLRLEGGNHETYTTTQQDPSPD